MKDVSDLAFEIFTNEFMSDSSVISEAVIYSWLETNVGNLNTALYESFEADEGGEYCFNDQAGDIFKSMYMQNYYARQSSNALRGILSGSGGSNIISVKEGDTSVTRVNNNEVAKGLRAAAADYRSQIDSMIAKYHINNANPVQVSGEDDCY